MTYDHPETFPDLEIPIDLFVRTGNAHALKTALADYALLDGFSAYLINLFDENLRCADLTKATHVLIELAHEFAGNTEQQQAVMALLSHSRS